MLNALYYVRFTGNYGEYVACELIMLNFGRKLIYETILGKFINLPKGSKVIPITVKAVVRLGKHLYRKGQPDALVSHGVDRCLYDYVVRSGLAWCG